MRVPEPYRSAYLVASAREAAVCHGLSEVVYIEARRHLTIDTGACGAPAQPRSVRRGGLDAGRLARDRSAEVGSWPEYEHLAGPTLAMEVPHGIGQNTRGSSFLTRSMGEQRIPQRECGWP